MPDLQKEFRTLKLLAPVLIILGVAICLGGLVAGLAAHSDEQRQRPRAAMSETSSDTESPAKKPDDIQKLKSYTSQLGFRLAGLGALIVVVGVVLRKVVKQNFDDDDEEHNVNAELYRTYAEQLALAAKRKGMRQRRSSDEQV